MFKITAVSPEVREYETKFGEMKSYKVRFEGSQDVVEISQKASTPAPTVGQELEGTITDTEYGKKFKKAFGQTGFQGGRKEDPAKQDSIMKQTSLKAAAQVSSKPEEVIEWAEQYFAWLKDKGEVLPQLNQDEPPIEAFKEDEIDLSDIPF